MLNIKPVNTETATKGRKAVAAHIIRDRGLEIGAANYRGQNPDYIKRDAMRVSLRPVAAAYSAYLPKLQAALDRLVACEAAEKAAMEAISEAPPINEDTWLEDQLSGNLPPAPGASPLTQRRTPRRSWTP